ncbi:MAG TPA: peptidoglycan-binding domain-containing protein [Terriglobia bacterium]|nr:peptidoglycan-binding domain-containing protein [Terriglobia bacterium]
MVSWKRNLSRFAVLAAVAFLLAVPLAARAGTRTGYRRHSRSTKLRAKRHRSKRPKRPRRKRTPRAGVGRSRGRSLFSSRFSHLQPQPGRVEEIQQGLEQAGYLQGEPTGKWDAATRDAMSRYQAANGFPVTGLPDSKSLMKMGLGPHPLPTSLDRASLNPAAAPPAADSQTPDTTVVPDVAPPR